ncbi:neutral zinc metallopeptidase [Actinopolyspora mzabensis]|uniref:neutral zinc metallopeptidase n=1 Tax=Actinopolyspora mzabensis TaxID=995066 RepID=UPI001FE0C49E|nr:neutral zinc metallopeptidase [Actinopolyspora mzabensis]
MVPDPEQDDRQPGNSPLAIFGVLGVVFLIVLVAVVAEPGKLLAGGGADSETTAVPEMRDGVPQPGFDPVALLERNPLNSKNASLEPADCRLPELAESEAGMRSYYEAAVRCLNTLWRPVVVGADLSWAPPEVSLRSRTSDCSETEGSSRPTAFYCDGTIHMPRQWVLSDIGAREPAHLILLAHEYGHHVQQRAGMLRASTVRQQESEVRSPEWLRISRRLELQADCYSGMFMAAAAEGGTLRDRVAERFVSATGSAELGDTHGSPENQRDWKLTGFRERTTAACDTWNVPAERVR